MKKIIALAISFVLCLTVYNSAFALNGPSISDVSNAESQDSRLQELEDKYGVKITLNDENTVLSNDDVKELEDFLSELTTTVDSYKVCLVSRTAQARGTMRDGLYNCSWNRPVDEHVSSDDGRYGFNVTGTLYMTWNVNKTTTNGKVYLSGAITGCYVVGSYSGSMSLLGGSINAEGNGTNCATTNPIAVCFFEVQYSLLTITFLHSFSADVIDFYLPAY